MENDAQSKARDAKYLADFRREEEEIEQGAVRLRWAVWKVEDDRVWRLDCDSLKEIKFSDLTNTELVLVMAAKVRQGKNRGIGGFFRRLGRKIDGPPIPRDIDAGNC